MKALFRIQEVTPFLHTENQTIREGALSEPISATWNIVLVPQQRRNVEPSFFEFVTCRRVSHPVNHTGTLLKR